MVASERRKWIALGLLSAVQFMVVLDIAIVNVALPSIKLDLGFSQANLQWVISAYALMFGGFLLLGGRMADLLGRRRIFLIGIVVFTLASFLAGLAWSEASLIGARALQGLGAAIISPAALSILSTTFKEGRERNIALGVWGAVGGFGAAAGVLLGGILTDALSWQWIFRVNVPVGIAAFVLTPFILTESRDAHVKSFDLPGAALVTAGLSSLVYAITQAGSEGWLAPRTVGFFVASVVMLVGFVAWEGGHADPLMRLGIFRTRTVTGGHVVGFVPRPAARAAVRPAGPGLASGLIDPPQQIGAALGRAALSTSAPSHASDQLAAGVAAPNALVDGFTAAFTVGAVSAAAGVVASLTLIRREELAAQAPEAQPALDLAA